MAYNDLMSCEEDIVYNDLMSCMEAIVYVGCSRNTRKGFIDVCHCSKGNDILRLACLVYVNQM